MFIGTIDNVGLVRGDVEAYREAVKIVEQILGIRQCLLKTALPLHARAY